MIHDTIDAKTRIYSIRNLLKKTIMATSMVAKSFSPEESMETFIVYVYLGLLWATASLDSRDTTLKSKAKAGNLLPSP